MSLRITIICDEPHDGGLCGSRRTTVTGPEVSTGEAMVRAHEDLRAEGWTPRREGGWRCLSTHTPASGA